MEAPNCRHDLGRNICPEHIENTVPKPREGTDVHGRETLEPRTDTENWQATTRTRTGQGNKRSEGEPGLMRARDEQSRRLQSNGKSIQRESADHQIPRECKIDSPRLPLGLTVSSESLPARTVPMKQHPQRWRHVSNARDKYCRQTPRAESAEDRKITQHVEVQKCASKLARIMNCPKMPSKLERSLRTGEDSQESCAKTENTHGVERQHPGQERHRRT